MTPRRIAGARLVLVGALIAWFFSPPDWRYAVPLWLPFAVALGLELEFALGAWRGSLRRTPRDRGRAPQRADLELYGWRGEPPDEDDDAFWSSAPVARPRTRWRRRVGSSAAVVALVALVAWGVTVRRGWSSLDAATRTHVEQVLSAQAARIAGHSVRVRCDTGGRHVGAVQETDGIAEVGGDEAWLTPEICFTLSRLIDGRDRHSFSPLGRAIAVLAHEAWHLHGVADEGIANCYAFQSGVGIGTDLGLTESRARALMREQLADNASDSAGDPRYLVPAGCDNGGRYDLHRASPRFP
ncbi:MAG: hypothetical protein ACRDM1_02850 [Gaiellaceae bacterium]